MTSDIKMWKRIELPAELHRELEREAKALHMSTQAYAAYLISRGLRIDRELAEVPFALRGEDGRFRTLHELQANCSHDWDGEGEPQMTCQRCGITLVRAE